MRPNRACRLRNVVPCRAVGGWPGRFRSSGKELSVPSGFRMPEPVSAGMCGKRGGDVVRRAMPEVGVRERRYRAERCARRANEKQAGRTGSAESGDRRGEGVTCRGRARTEPAEERPGGDAESGAVACAGPPFRRRQRAGEERGASGAGAGRYEGRGKRAIPRPASRNLRGKG